MKLAEVNHALKQGEKQKAMQMLKTVLQENPSADAWYLAAKLSNDKEKAIGHLRRALTLNSSHAKSRDLLRELGGAPQGGGGESGGGHFLSLIWHEFERVGENNRFLGQMQSRQRGILVSVTLVIMLALIIIQVSSLFSPSSPPPAPARLAEQTFGIVDSQTFAGHIQASGLPIPTMQNFAPNDEEKAHFITEKHVVALQDGTEIREATIYFYETSATAIADQFRLGAEYTDYTMVFYNSAVLLYPTQLSTGVATSLKQAFQSIPLS